MPGNGRSWLPPAFLWLPLPISGLGSLGFPASWHVVAEGLAPPESGKKWPSASICAILFYYWERWLREEDRLGDSTRAQVSQEIRDDRTH
jgi:hypothetical protein